MGQKTKIEWTEYNWNPIRGCSRVSEGCKNCYAESIAYRFKGEGQPYEGLIAKGGQWNGEIKVIDKLIDQPLRWKKSRKIFVNSMSDLFHENVPEDTLWEIFAVMALAQQHTFQILTKRPERMLEFMRFLESCPDSVGEYAAKFSLWEDMPELDEWPPKNIWLGVSAEDQKTANERIPLLLQTPAAIRWISAEPLLGPIDLNEITIPSSAGEYIIDALHCEEDLQDCGDIGNRTLDWVVVGGESGKKARRMDPDWARLLRDQCRNANVSYFFKQWGEFAPTSEGMYRIGKNRSGRTLDGQIYSEYPA